MIYFLSSGTSYWKQCIKAYWGILPRAIILKARFLYRIYMNIYRKYVFVKVKSSFPGKNYFIAVVLYRIVKGY